MEELLESLVATCRDPARLLELYYWSTERELLPIIRGFAALPADVRRLIESFLAATDPKSVHGDIDRDGSIRLIMDRAIAKPIRRQVG